MFIPINVFGKKKSDEKDKQIKELRTTFPSIRRPNNDDTNFELLFEVGRIYSSLRIYLLPDFPIAKPGTFIHIISLGNFLGACFPA